MRDIWFELCFGEIDCDESGKRTFEKDKSYLSVLSLTGELNKDSRKELHRLLDQAINRLN
jgi:hypothetical protein